MKNTPKTLFTKDLQYYKFCIYGFLKNLRFFEPFLILFFLENGLTFFQIGTLYAIREIVRNIFEIPSGIFADAIGRRRSMIITFIFYIISFLIFYFSNVYYLFFIAMLFFSIGDAFRTGTHKAMIFEYLKIKAWQDQKIHYYGHTRSWSQFGSGISALLAAFVVFFHGNYNSIFLFTIIPYLIDLMLMISYPKELDGKTKMLKTEKIKESFLRIFKDLRYTFKKPEVLRAIVNTSSYSGYYKAVKDYIQPILHAFALSLPMFLYMNNKQRSSIIIGVVYFLIFLLTSITSRHSGKFADKFKNISKPLNITLLIGLSAGILSGIFYNINISIISILLYVIIFVIENLRKPIGISFVAEKIEKDIMATALSVESQVKSIFAAITAILIGYFSDIFNPGIALAICSGIILLLYPLFRAKQKRKPRIH